MVNIYHRVSYTPRHASQTLTEWQFIDLHLQSFLLEVTSLLSALGTMWDEVT